MLFLCCVTLTSYTTQNKSLNCLKGEYNGNEHIRQRNKKSN